MWLRKLERDEIESKFGVWLITSMSNYITKKIMVQTKGSMEDVKNDQGQQFTHRGGRSLTSNTKGHDCNNIFRNDKMGSNTKV